MSESDATGLPTAAPPTPATDGRIVWFGVRHHSPTAARLVGQLIQQHRPVAVLIEGPSDYTPHLAEFALDHSPPVMLYSWAPLPSVTTNETESPEQTGVVGDYAGDDVTRRGAFYPFCTYSPEWAATRAGLESGAEVAFIDLPWRRMVGLADAENRFADRARARDFVTLLGERLGSDTVAGTWDELIELDPALGLDDYLERITVLGEGIRAEDGDEPDEEDRSETVARERWMAAQVAAALDRHETGWILVVVGAFHTPGLRRLLEEDAVGPADLVDDVPPADDPRFGTALTPTSYTMLDALEGYNAGQPNPGFYDALFADRAAGRSDTAERLLAVISAELRVRKQYVSAADLIAVLSTARALAALRGHPEVWRTDLVEAIGSALIKDEVSGGHPVLELAQRLLRGDAVGRLDPRTRRPPLVLEIVAALTSEGLYPSAAQVAHHLDLATEDGLRRSQLLHALATLDVVAGNLSRAARPFSGEHEISETWQLLWTEQFEASLVLAARFGATIEAAVSARLLAEAAEVLDDVAAATRILLKAALAGLSNLSDRFHHRLHELMARTGDLRALGDALAMLMQMYRYDPVLHTTGRTDLADLVRVAFDRGVRLLERLGPLPDGPAADPTIATIRVLADTALRVETSLDLDVDGLDSAFERLCRDDQQAASVRGAGLGGRWLLGAAEETILASSVRAVANPAALGDFVAGLTSVAREVALRRVEVLEALDDLVADFAEDEFLVAAPGLRRAFTGLTPRERAQVAGLLLSRSTSGGDSPAEAWSLQLLSDPADFLRVTAFEAQLFDALAGYGLVAEDA